MGRRVNRKHLESAVGAEVYHLLNRWCHGLQIILGDRLIGAYLTGSLTHGDFVATRSDIDLAVVVVGIWRAVRNRTVRK